MATEGCKKKSFASKADAEKAQRQAQKRHDERGGDWKPKGVKECTLDPAHDWHIAWQKA